MPTLEVKKNDLVRKGYKKESAVKSERSLLNTIADYLYTKYDFGKSFIGGSPTFGDVLKATGFYKPKKLYEYFRTSVVRKDQTPGYTCREGITSIMENEYTFDEWKYLINLNFHINPQLHSVLDTDIDGRKIIILENNFYNVGLVKNIMLKSHVITPKDLQENKLDIKNAESDSSTTP
jgi:hypothetical protein